MKHAAPATGPMTLVDYNTPDQQRRIAIKAFCRRCRGVTHSGNPGATRSPSALTRPARCIRCARNRAPG